MTIIEPNIKPQAGVFENNTVPTGHSAVENAIAEHAKYGTEPVISEESAPNPSRRRFLGSMTAAAAGASMAGCIRKPVEKILPHKSRPEDLIPGKARYFATSSHIGDAVLGLVVESQDGRPKRVDGNPNHPLTQGCSTGWAQASVMDLYDQDRWRTAQLSGEELDAEGLDKFIAGLRAEIGKSGGKGLAVLKQRVPSPSFEAQLKALLAAYPGARVYEYDPMHTGSAENGAALVGEGRKLKVRYTIDKAKVIVAADTDFMLTEGDCTRISADFSVGRRLEKPEDGMNRLYSIEANFSGTGALADNRLRMKSSEIGPFLVALARRLGPAIPSSKLPNVAKPQGAKIDMWLDAVAADLLENKGASVIAVGSRQPAHVHALAHLINTALGNVGVTIQYTEDKEALQAGTIQEFAASIKGGTTQQLIILGGDPCYDAPADLDLATLVKGVPTSVYLSNAPNDTSDAVTCTVPMTHYLEAWGDLRASDGVLSIQQPLIAPLFSALSAIELLDKFIREKSRTGYQIVQDHWLATAPQEAASQFTKNWRRWLHDGFSPVNAKLAAKPNFRWEALTAAWPKTKPAGADSLELNFIIDGSVADGRYANNAWLQEVPDNMTKVAWDNALGVSPKLARSMEIETGDMVKVTLGERSLTLAALVTRGLADNALVVALGYGKSKGRVSEGVGFNSYLLRTTDAMFFVEGAKLEKASGTYPLACSQTMDNQMDRGIAREADLDDFREDPRFVEKDELIAAKYIKSPWKEPEMTGKQQWGMTIDLNACNGCNACAIACYTENNVSIVGKEEMLNGREMSWMRMDRYYEGSEEDPQVRFQPMSCAHCETAPCENVCPVQATAHSPDGLNDMAYNRCIGTRYCANNCPYKVRRFNFFNYSKRNHELLGAATTLANNPDVTVRFRGVMEKCTYCVQRINEAKIKYKREADGFIPDGKLKLACEESCSTGAIVFGDINDEKSRVSKTKKDPRNYGVLSQLNIRPRTTYLANVRNPNPRIS